MTRFTLGYATSARRPQEGGPGGSLALSLYEGTQGMCNRGTVAKTTGGNEARFSFFQLPSCAATVLCPGYFMTAFLPDNDAACWSDGKIGWGYEFIDDDGTGAAQTGPMLVEYSASTCWADAFDLWSSPDEFASCAGTFFFGGCTLPITFGVLRFGAEGLSMHHIDCETGQRWRPPAR